MDFIILLLFVVIKKELWTCMALFSLKYYPILEIEIIILISKKIIFVSITKQKLEQIMITIASDIHLMNWSAFDVEIWSSAFLIWHNLWNNIDNFAISCQLIHLILLDFDFWYYWHRIKRFHHLKKPILHVQNWNVFPKSPDHSIRVHEIEILINQLVIEHLVLWSYFCPLQ